MPRWSLCPGLYGSILGALGTILVKIYLGDPYTVRTVSSSSFRIYNYILRYVTFSWGYLFSQVVLHSLRVGWRNLFSSCAIVTTSQRSFPAIWRETIHRQKNFPPPKTQPTSCVTTMAMSISFGEFPLKQEPKSVGAS